MSKKKKITYIREFLESMFPKEELTSANVRQQEETIEQKFKRVWEEKILTQCDSVRFLNAKGFPTKIPTSRVEVTDREGLWLFEYDPSGKNKSFWYSKHRVHKLLEKEVSSDVTVLQRLIKSWVGDTLGTQGATPGEVVIDPCAGVGDTLGTQGATPRQANKIIYHAVVDTLGTQGVTPQCLRVRCVSLVEGTL